MNEQFIFHRVAKSVNKQTDPCFPFDVKYYSDLGDEVHDKIVLSYPEARWSMNKIFDEHPDAARYEEWKTEDGRMVFTVKDRNYKIMCQFKQIQ